MVFMMAQNGIPPGPLALDSFVHLVLSRLSQNVWRGPEEEDITVVTHASAPR